MKSHEISKSHDTTSSNKIFMMADPVQCVQFVLLKHKACHIGLSNQRGY